MKLFGNPKIYLYFFGILFSCASPKIGSQNKVLYDIYTYWSNDSLQMSGRFFGDYQFLDKVPPQDLKAILSYTTDLLGYQVHQKHLIFYAHTHNAPYLQGTLLKIPQKKLDLPFFQNDTLPFYQKIDTLGKKYAFTTKIFPYKNDFYVLVGSTHNRQKWKEEIADQEQLLNIRKNSLVNEFEEISKTFILGKNYQKTIPPNPFGLASQAFKTKDSVDYWKALQTLKAIEPNYSSKSEKFLWKQAYLTYASFIKNAPQYADFIAEWHQLRRQKKFNIKSFEISFQKNEAKKQLLDQTATSQLVMFNENHFMPENRYFLMDLLEDFRKQGFEYLALEALGKDSELMTRQYPLQNSGFYLSEATMALLVRRALDLGFKLISYDSPNDADRDYEQAQNIFNQSFAKNPQTKVLVLVGIEHLSKKVDAKGKRWLGRILQDDFGLSPLCIDQVSYQNMAVEMGKNELILAKAHEKIPNLFGSDWFVINNLDMEKIIPYKDCFPLEIGFPSLPEDKIFLIYNKNEYAQHHSNAIPLQVQYLSPLQKSVKIFLPKGQYCVVVKDAYNEVIFFKKILH